MAHVIGLDKAEFEIGHGPGTTPTRYVLGFGEVADIGEGYTTRVMTGVDTTIIENITNGRVLPAWHPRAAKLYAEWLAKQS